MSMIQMCVKSGPYTLKYHNNFHLYNNPQVNGDNDLVPTCNSMYGILL